MKNKIRVIVALICALAVVGTSTFAWGQIVAQKNEFWGRHKNSHLHDDFNPGTGQKDVYVENTGNVTLYVRVKLDETMNIGSHTWRPQNDSQWVTHTHEDGDPVDCGNTNHQGRLFHNYFTWTMGGSKWYMPASTTGGSVVQDTNIYDGNTPGAKQTPNAAIVTASEFLAMNEDAQKAFIGWIYSTDGYAYWSQPLPAGEATGLLLHGVSTSNSLNNTSYYYAINVIAEVVDRADAKQMWLFGENSVDGSPKQPEETSDNGKDTIWIIIGPDGGDGNEGGNGNGSPAVSINGGNKTIAVGEKLQLTYGVTPSGYDSGKEIVWSTSNGAAVDFDDEADGDGCFIGMAVGTSTITVTIGEGEETITATITVTVTDGTMPPNPGTELPVNPGPFTPITAPDPMNGDGYYCKHDFTDEASTENNFIYHNGAIHLEDVITDGNYTGVTVSATGPYAPYISIGNDHHGKPSIIYNYLPTNQQWIDQLGHGEMLIPVQVRLTRGTQSATVTINMTYPGCLIKVDM